MSHNSQRKKPKFSNMEDQINNIVKNNQESYVVPNPQKFKNLDFAAEKSKNLDVSVVKQEKIVKGSREILKIDDNDEDGENSGVTLIYDTEIEEILGLIKGATEGNPIVLEDIDDDDQVEVTKTLFRGECSSSKTGNRVIFDLDDEFGSYPPVFVCEICTESMPVHDKFRIMGCEHFYCSGCVSQYVGSKIEENVTRIVCPVSGCCGVLEPQNCREILSKQVFERWGDALCEGVISASQKFYCPFKDCSALLIDDGGGRDLGGEVIRESECPNCWRLFCAQCKVPWHPDAACEDFQKLSLDEREREDILLMNLAKTKNWKRCPECKFYVERIDGCLFMHCRCGYNFCYSCGGHMTDHFCPVCKR